MASLYKNNNTWYLSVSHNGIRKTRSLKTKSYKVAKTIKSHAESTLMAEINGFVIKNENLSFDKLCKRFLLHNHSWSINTYKLSFAYSHFLLHRGILVKMGEINKNSCAELYFWISWT